MIYRWVFEGALDDPFDEFFVGSHSNIPLDRLWYRKYEFRDSMRPAFIKRELADRVCHIAMISSLRPGDWFSLFDF